MQILGRKAQKRAFWRKNGHFFLRSGHPEAERGEKQKDEMMTTQERNRKAIGEDDGR